jgi:tetratricopeptide (TPR) repeat protein
MQGRSQETVGPSQFPEAAMQYRLWISFLVIFLLVKYAQAQRYGMSAIAGTGSVHVRVVFDNDRHAGGNLLVRLMKGSSSTPVDTSYTNDTGQAEFHMVPIGEYNVEVSGEGIEMTRSPVFEVDERKVTQSQYVVVHRLTESGPKLVNSKSAAVSASDLNIPAKARKELDKANESILLQDFKKGLQHLQKAITIAPRYVTAYNNLGVLYARMNDVAHEQEALEKAVSLDDHFALALLNLGRLCIQQKNFLKAESLLGKAVGIEPTNPESLMLLADAEYMDEHYDAAISNARQAHAVAPDHPSFAHYIAARAYEHENKPQAALAEFQIFLQEEPNGPRAEHVRRDIARMASAQ